MQLGEYQIANIYIYIYIYIYIFKRIKFRYIKPDTSIQFFFIKWVSNVSKPLWCWYIIKYLLNLPFWLPPISSKSEEFNLKDIKVPEAKQDQSCLKWPHIGQYLKRVCIKASTTKLAKEDMKSWAFLQVEGVNLSMDPPKERRSRS